MALVDCLVLCLIIVSDMVQKSREIFVRNPASAVKSNSFSCFMFLK